MGATPSRKIEPPHQAPDLEALIPADVMGWPTSTSSYRGTGGDSRLSRALKRLAVKPQRIHTASGIAGSGDRTFTIDLYRVPGVAADRLVEEFAAAIYRPPKAMWQPGRIADRTVMWAQSRIEGRLFTIAYWARDELVVHVSGDPADITETVPRLP